MAKSAAALLEGITQENLKPVYFLHGDEIYYPNAIAKKIVDVAIPDHEKGFNEFILFGKDLTVGAVLNNARRFPMMAERQLVVVRDAEQIQDIGTKEAQAMLESYARNPLQTTILVLVFGKSMDERKSFVKSFSEKGELLNSKRLYDNQVPDFIMSICHSKERKISPKAAQLLFEHTGNNLESIVKEIEKIMINLSSDEEISAETIQEQVGISKDYNVFELQKAIIQKDAEKCFRIINYFAANTKDNPIQPVILILYNFFSKLLLFHANSKGDLATLLKVNPYFVKDYTMASQRYPAGKVIQIISALRKSDQYSKGVDTGTKDDLDIYKELIYTILS
jgi:DNA polymerase-3 subunit delta